MQGGDDEFKTPYLDAEWDARSSSRLKLTRTGIVAGELSERVGGAENIHNTTPSLSQIQLAAAR